MINLYKKSKEVEPPEERGKAIQKLIEDSLDLERWGFKLTYQDFSKFAYQILVYDSQYCRFRVSFSRGRLPKRDELHVGYGRLHASLKRAFMNWKNEECHCWHSRNNHLWFLDGLNANEAVERYKNHKLLPQVIEDYYNSKLGIKLRKEYPPKSAIMKQSMIWEHYGQRLFDLFDLRQPELWGKYRAFLKEYYRLTGETSQYGPPYENVC